MFSASYENEDLSLVTTDKDFDVLSLCIYNIYLANEHLLTTPVKLTYPYLNSDCECHQEHDVISLNLKGLLLVVQKERDSPYFESYFKNSSLQYTINNGEPINLIDLIYKHKSCFTDFAKKLFSATSNFMDSMTLLTSELFIKNSQLMQDLSIKMMDDDDTSLRDLTKIDIGLLHWVCNNILLTDNDVQNIYITPFQDRTYDELHEFLRRPEALALFSDLYIRYPYLSVPSITANLIGVYEGIETDKLVLVYCRLVHCMENRRYIFKALCKALNRNINILSKEYIQHSLLSVTELLSLLFCSKKEFDSELKLYISLCLMLNSHESNVQYITSGNLFHELSQMITGKQGNSFASDALIKLTEYPRWAMVLIELEMHIFNVHGGLFKWLKFDDVMWFFTELTDAILAGCLRYEVINYFTVDYINFLQNDPQQFYESRRLWNDNDLSIKFMRTFFATQERKVTCDLMYWLLLNNFNTIDLSDLSLIKLPFTDFLDYKPKNAPIILNDKGSLKNMSLKNSKWVNQIIYIYEDLKPIFNIKKTHKFFYAICSYFEITDLLKKGASLDEIEAHINGLLVTAII